MDFPLRCNNHNGGYCRKELRTEAFVTTCSHIFCTECVKKYGFQDRAGGGRKCLACGVDLPACDDVVLSNLRPKDETQSTLLSGLDPSTILECTSKALRFWNYQQSTEIAWQEHLAKEWTNRYTGLNNNARKVIEEANTEIGELQKQVESLTIQKQEAEKRVEELAAMYKDKSKRCQTAQQLYETLKKKVQHDQVRGAAAASADQTLQSLETLPRSGSFAYPSHREAPFRNTTVRYTPRQPKLTMDYQGVEQFHPYQRSGSATRAQTSSEVATAGVNTVAPPMRSGTCADALDRFDTTTTPAKRVSLSHGRAMSNSTLPLLPTNHRTAAWEHATNPIHKHSFGRDRPKHQSVARGQYVSGCSGMTPNTHARIAAQRGLC